MKEAVSTTNAETSRRRILSLIVATLFLLILSVLLWHTNEEKIEIAEQVEQTTEAADSLRTIKAELIAQIDSLQFLNNDQSEELMELKLEVEQLIISEKNLRQAKLRISQLQEEKNAYAKRVEVLEEENDSLAQAVRRQREEFRRTVNIQNERERVLQDALDSEKEANGQLAAQIYTNNETSTPVANPTSSLLVEQVEIKALAMNRSGTRSKPVRKARQVKVLRTTFNILPMPDYSNKNLVLYLRIEGPDGTTITDNMTTQNTFEATDGSKYLYTQKVVLDYQGEQLPVMIDWQNQNQLVKGNHTVQLFQGGTLIEEQILTLR